MKPDTQVVALNVWLGSNVIGLLAATFQLVSGQRDVTSWIMTIGFVVGLLSGIWIRRARRSAG